MIGASHDHKISNLYMLFVTGSVSMDNHPIFTKDPQDWKDYIYKEVCVESIDGKKHVGWVYTIDPVSETIVLIRFREDKNVDLELILGHTAQTISIINDNTDSLHRDELDYMFRPRPVRQYSETEMNRRKEKLKNWLIQNRLPVIVTGKKDEILTISDALYIEPPYGIDTCQSTNEIILGRIQDLISNMPE